MSLIKTRYILFFFLAFSLSLHAQETVVPIQDNAYLSSVNSYPKNKKRATLPFLDDFSYRASLPNPALWEDQQVFINNTMGINVLTQGVATFDGLNQEGRPYNPNNFSATGFGDSLTCTPIDLSFRNPGDSIKLSFWVQPQGNGFAPEVNDSLYLFFKNSANNWVKVWQANGSTTQDFKQVFIIVEDVQYFHANFQFRFINFTSLNLNDDVWNIDYVEMDVNRTINDTTINDVAFTQLPTSILATYTAMPYKHFISSDLSTQQEILVSNNYDVANTFTVRHSAQEIIGATNLSTNALAPFNAFAKSIATLNNPSYGLSLLGAGPFTVRNTYTIDPISAQDYKGNDTIVTDVVFDNYFAYDDGTAEKAYFLSAALNQPAKTAIKFELRQADTVHGLSIYFAAQVPSAVDKFFSIVLYDSLGNTTAGDVVIHQQDLYKVQYPTVRSEFSSYAFATPVGLGPGTYYIGLTQPANFSSDSIYYGLDVNTDNNLQKLSYNVNGFWFNSSTTGTVMMRPMVGASFNPIATKDVEPKVKTILYPNPSSEELYVQSETKWETYQLFSMNGQLVENGTLEMNKIDIKHLPNGNYMVKLLTKNTSVTHTICKQ